MKKNNNTIILIIILIILLIATSILIYVKSNNNNKASSTISSEITVSSLIKNSKVFKANSEETNDEIGLYKFNDDGTFEYSNAQTITKENQILTMKGKYKIENNTLILTIEDKRITAQGYLKTNEDSSNLCEYKIETDNTVEEQKYNLKVIDNNYLKGDNLTLYPSSNNNEDNLDNNTLNIPRCFENYTIEEIKTKALDYFKKNQLEKLGLDQETEFTIGVSLNKNDIPEEYNNYDMYIEINHIYSGRTVVDARYFINAENLTGIEGMGISNQEINLNN